MLTADKLLPMGMSDSLGNSETERLPVIWTVEINTVPTTLEIVAKSAFWLIFLFHQLRPKKVSISLIFCQPIILWIYLLLGWDCRVYVWIYFTCFVTVDALRFSLITEDKVFFG